MNHSLSRKWVWWCILGTLVAGAIFALWPNDTKTVKKLMREWMGAIEKSGPESLTVAAGKQFRVASLLAADSSFDVGPPFPDLLDKEGFVSMLHYARSQVNSVRIIDRGSDIKRMDRDHIHVDITVDVMVDHLNRIDSMIGAYRFVWMKISNDWRIQRIEHVAVIEHPDPGGFNLPRY